MAQDTFYEDLLIPFNDEDPDFDFVNHVHAQQKLVEGQNGFTEYTEHAERHTKVIGRATKIRNEAERDLRRLRRQVLASNFGQFKASYGEEARDAFVYKKAEETGRLEDLLTLEAVIETQTREIESHQYRLDLVRGRLKAIEKTMDTAVHLLNLHKHEQNAQRKR